MSKGSVPCTLKKILYVILIMASISGCGPRQHTAIKAPEPTAWCNRTIDDIHLTITPCSLNKHLRSHLKGYQVLNVVVENKTQNSLILSGHNISLPLASGKSIQKKVGGFSPLYQAPAVALGAIGLVFM